MDAQLARRDPEKENYQDRWQNVLIYPLHTKQGKIVACAAHDPDTKALSIACNPRLQSPRDVLYGLSVNRIAIRNAGEALLVPDLEDVLILHQAGIENAVACPKEALTPEHVRLLKQVAPRIIVVHDARPAALHSAIRALHTALSGGMKARDVTLPQGIQPGKVVLEDGATLLQEEYLQKHRSFVDLIVQLFSRQSTQEDDQPIVIHAIATALANISDSVLQEQYSHHAADALSVPVATIAEALKNAQEVHALQASVEFFQDQLMHTSTGDRERARLKRAYGIDADSAHTFGLGYAPDDWGALRKAMQVKGIPPEPLRDAGLLHESSKRDDGPWFYDGFRGRIIFPVFSGNGRVAGLWGVSLGLVARTDRTSTRLKETTFALDEHLYGLYQYRLAPLTSDSTLIVEHAMDVLTLHSAGIPHTVTPLGHTLTPGMCTQLKKRAPHVVLVYGKNHELDLKAIRTHYVQPAQASGLDADLVILQEDSTRSALRKHGKEAFLAYLQEHRRPFSEFQGGTTRIHERRIGTLTTKSRQQPAASTTPPDPSPAIPLAPIYKALEHATSFFRYHLQSPAATNYLEERGFSTSIIETFQLGYAPDQWDTLLKDATGQNISVETLHTAGLVKPNQEGTSHYDVFRGRLIFPIHATDGRVIGFGGRILKPDPRAPKYLNTPETPVYKKSSTLYGLHRSADSARKRKELILVEGYTDVLAMHQAGFTNAVACCGTALTSGQIHVLRNYAPHLIMLYDADQAGAKATLRAIDLALEGSMTPFAAALPPGEDPDSFVGKNGAAALQEYLHRHKKGFLEFLHHHYQDLGTLASPDGTAEAVHAVLMSISKISDTQQREEAVSEASELFGVSLDALQDGLNQKMSAPAQPHFLAPTRRDESRRIRDPRKRKANTGVHPAEKRLLELMLTRPSLIESIRGQIKGETFFTSGPSRELAVLLFATLEDTSAPPGSIAEDSRVKHLAEVLNLKQTRPALSSGWDEHGRDAAKYDEVQDVNSAIKQLKLHHIQKRLDEIQKRFASATQEEQEKLVARQQALLQARREVEAPPEQ